MWINPIDANARNLQDGDWVKVFNDRGTIFIPIQITNKIVPGVIAIPQGAWHETDAQGNDVRGIIINKKRHKVWFEKPNFAPFLLLK